MSGLRRAYILDGDKTTANGTVEAPHRGMIFDGKNVCFEGDKVWCPACKSHGVTQCVQPYRPSTGPNGRQMNLEGDLCLCGCPTPPKLIASQHNRYMSFTHDEVSGVGSSFEPVGKPDEQVRAVDATTGEPISGLAYYIQTPDGTIYTGHTDNDGLCERVETDQPDDLVVLFGEDAEEKMRGA